LKKPINLREIVNRVLQIEIDALENLQNSINNNVEEVIKMITNLKGRVVVSGVGKSALIAQKWVASFNSTGTPALFMHAADAVHGDLGMIQEGDLVFILSKSGGSEEIKTLALHLKNLNQPFVAITSNPDSIISKKATLSILTPVEKEACPHDLAPTASTTVQLALGDALMVATLESKGFKAEQFAQFHPGGSLGKRLTLKVKDLINPELLPKVHPSSTFKEVIVEISKNLLGCAVVCDGTKIMGMITDGDLRRMLEKSHDFDSIEAASLMSLNPKSISSDYLASEALHIMNSNEITQLIVVDGSNYVGILHLHNLIQAGLV
jgi:arabinose-5-phosphate isomerase